MIRSTLFSKYKFSRSYDLRAYFHGNINDVLNLHDKTQVSLLEEKCILVNENDHVIGAETKKNCHLIKNINNGMLHRAFSIFLFDENNRMLLQQRSDFKITYPNLWTNTCCSHPLFVDDEREDSHGIKKAARRRLLYEFGINVKNINDFKYITRIHYKAFNQPSDDLFAEHEIDYILFIKGIFNINHNPNEIKSYKYLTPQELEILMKNPNVSETTWQFTPWFKLICDKFLFEWWKNLENLEKIQDHNNIYRFV